MDDKLNLTKEEAFCALYYFSRPLGMGMMHYVPGGISLEEARERLAQSSYVDYHRGRVIKVDFAKELSLNSGAMEHATRLYDRDNGEGAAERALLDYATTPESQRGKFHGT